MNKMIWTREIFIEWLFNTVEDYTGNDNKFLPGDIRDIDNFVKAINAWEEKQDGNKEEK